MNCPNCKAEISDDMKFCIKCGTKIEMPAPKPEETVAQIPKVAPANSEPAEKPAQAADAQAAPEKPADTPKAVTDARPGVSDKPAEEAKSPASALPALCAKCGAPLKEGTKFCTRCGAPVASVNAGAQPAASAPQYSGVASLGASSPAPAAAPAEAPAPAKKSSFKGLIIIILLVIAALVVAILLALKSFGVFSGGRRPDTGASQTSDRDDDEEEDDEDEPEEEDPEAAAARAAEIDEIRDRIKDYVKEGDQSEGISDSYPAALDLIITLANDYDLADEVSREAEDIFSKYSAQVKHSVELLDGQKVRANLYVQARTYYDEILGYADKLKKAGITVDSSEMTEASDNLIEVYRAKYILAINEISSRDNWSRDEAWELASDAASLVDDDGNMILFSLDDLDDPLRLRYIYSLAWVTRKHIETGIKDKTMTAEDALDEIDRVLKETDYNLQLIYDGIYYCSEAGIDPTPYTEAFNTIMEKLGENEGILIILDPSKATETNIDLNHFWAFNDIGSGADPDFQVSTTNGTTAETRAWIRDNIRINR